MAELIFKREFPDVLRPEFQRYFEKFDCIMPRWINTITLHYQPQPEDYEAIMEVVTRTEYRTVDIVVYSDYLLINDDERKGRAFLHEFCHVFYAQLHRQALYLAELLSDEISQNLAFEGIRMANEAATEDLAYMLGNILLNKTAIAEPTNYTQSDLDQIVAIPTNSTLLLNKVAANRKAVIALAGNQTAQTKVPAKPRKKKA
jgi:hypothetical protein